MIKRVLVVAALIALLAGCGGSRHAQPPPETHPKPKPKPVPHGSQKVFNLVVTVLDGDRRVRVRDARVSLGGKSGRTDRHGVTTIRAPRKRPLTNSMPARASPHAKQDARGSRAMPSRP